MKHASFRDKDSWKDKIENNINNYDQTKALASDILEVMGVRHYSNRKVASGVHQELALGLDEIIKEGSLKKGKNYLENSCLR